MILKTQLSVKTDADILLDELDIKGDGIDTWVDFNVILPKVESYRQRYQGEGITDGCVLTFGGVSYIINTDYLEFDRVMRSFYGMPY